MRSFSSRAGLFMMLPIACLSVGCGLFDKHKALKVTAGEVPVAQAVATWDKRIYHVPDTMRGGTPMPALIGRVYLFGPEITAPLPAEGSLVVELYDHTPRQHGGEAKLLEEWHFDPESLKIMLKKDFVGWGYSIPLPWGTYRPDVEEVYLAARFEPLNGSTVHIPGSMLKLDHSAKPEDGVWQAAASQPSAKSKPTPSATPAPTPVPSESPMPELILPEPRELPE